MSQFAVVVKVELPEGHTIEQGRQMLETFVIPDVKSHPGFVTGYWLSPPTGRDGLSFVIYNDEASARAAAEGVKPPPPVKLVDVEVREVAAGA
jgi:hypothetical protein